MTTAYILLAIRFEEADLLAAHGEQYRQYLKDVPMISRVGRQGGSGKAGGV